MEQLITSYYNAILRVDPTPAQITLWLNLIDPNDPEPGIEDLTDALCFQADEVLSIMRIYQVVLGRVPDPGGLDFWVQVFRDMQDANPGLSYREALVETIRDWLSSQEFVAVYGDNLTDEEYVALLYINVLNRPPDQEGFNFWVNELKSGAITREGLVIAFSESVEFGLRVDAEAKGILLYDAQISSTDPIDDPEHRVENDNPYQGELQNEAPTAILLGTDVDENSADGGPVNGGQLTVVDPDPGDTHTWELIDDAGGAFKLDDPNAQSPNIVVADGSLLDHETADSLSVTVRVTDSRGNTLEETFSIDINDVNEAPFDLQLSNTTIDEQDGSASSPGVAGTVIGVLSASDIDDGDSFVWEVDDPRFAIGGVDGNELIVADPAAFDAEAGVSSIDVTVRVRDKDGDPFQESIAVEKTFTIDVTPINDEDPTNVDPDILNIAATLPKDFLLTNLFADDPDTTPGTHTFSIKTDPTGGAFKVDASGTQLILDNPDLLGSNVLADPVVNLVVTVTDDAGNSYDDTIVINVDQSGVTLPFTGATVEVLDGTPGNDAFTANAGLGDFGLGPLPPGFGRTANGGDIANGGEGYDWFLLTKQDDSGNDGFTFISGVTLNNIEAAGISNRDINPFAADETPNIQTSGLCVPCIAIPDLAPSPDNMLVYEASTSPDLDFISFYQSLASVGIWDVQSEFWTIDGADANDAGPVVNIDDVTADLVHFDSDPQAKLLGDPIDMLTFTVSEVRINELLITENASLNEPGIMRGEQVGTILIEASGIPSTIGSINNGAGPLDPTGATTHTLNFHVGNITGTSPTMTVPHAFAGSPAAEAAAAIANRNAIDLFVGHFDGIGNGLLGLENVNITGGGDFFGVFGAAANDTDSDLDTHPLEITDGAGSSFFFFEQGGFPGVSIDAGDGDDTVGVFAEDLPTVQPVSDLAIVTNVERLKLLETVGNGLIDGFAGDGLISLWNFDETLDEVLLAGGVNGDLAIVDIPARAGAETDLDVLCDSIGEPGVWINIMQKCSPNDGFPALMDFDLWLDGRTDTTRVDVNFAIGTDSFVDTFATTDIQVLRINVEDPSLTISNLNADVDLDALILTDDGAGPPNTITILDPDNPATSSIKLVNGSSGTYNQRLFTAINPAMMFLPVFANWTPDSLDVVPPIQFNNDADNIFTAAIGAPIDELVVNADGAKFNMGSGSDWVSGNVNANGILDATPGGTGLGADSFEMNDGNDKAFGFGGEDAMEGGNGDDELHGGDGNDTMFGDERDDPTSSGNDLMFGGAGNDRMDGGDGNDIMFGGSGRDFMVGGQGNDTLCGDGNSDCLHGGTGNDLIIGGTDDTGVAINAFQDWQGDVLFAGTGIDLLIGDSSCEPQCFTVELTAEMNVLGEGDVYTVDVDGGGVDLSYTVTNANWLDPTFGIDDIIKELESQWVDQPGGIVIDIDIGDPADQYDDVLIIKNWDATNAPIAKPVATGTDGPLCDIVGTAADITVTIGGKVGWGDTFQFEVKWDGGSKLYSYTVDFNDFPDIANPPTVDDIRTILLNQAAGDPPGNGITIGAGAGAGEIRIQSNPSQTEKIGELEVIASATEDPAVFDMLGTPTEVCYTISGTIEEGDVYRVDLNGDAIYDAFYTVQAGDVVADVYQGLINAVNAVTEAALPGAGNITAYSSSQVAGGAVISTVDQTAALAGAVNSATAFDIDPGLAFGLHPFIDSAGRSASILQTNTLLGSSDWFKFTITGDERVVIDLDLGSTVGIFAPDDLEITLFDTDGTSVLLVDDDSLVTEGAAGSTTTADPYLEFDFTGFAAGDYFVRIDDFAGGGFDAAGIDYVLNISIEDPTPIPVATDFKLAILDGTNPIITVDDVNSLGGIDEATYEVDDTFKIDNGDTYRIDIDLTGNGVVGDAGDIFATYVTSPGDTHADVAAALEAALNSGANAIALAAAGQMVTVVDNVITVTGSIPALNEVYIEGSVVNAGVFACDVWTIDTTNWTAFEDIEVTIEDDSNNDGTGDGPPGPQVIDIPFNGTIGQSLQDLADAIEGWMNLNGFADVGVTVDIPTESITVQSTDGFVLSGVHVINPGSDLVAGPTTVTEDFDIDGPGNVHVVNVVNSVPAGPGVDDQDIAKVDETIGSGPSNDDTQSFSGSDTEGTDGQDKANDAKVTYDNESEFTHKGDDVFVAQAVNMDVDSANWLAFQGSGFDNDDIPYDFRGTVAGETMGAVGTDGADLGVKNVTYVGDWKNGNDLLAFQHEDPDGPDGPLDGDLGPAGNALNYAEFENISATRDDADATAASIFEGAPSLRYVAIARNDGATDADNYLRVYFNAEGTDKAPEAVFELLGYDSKTDISFTDITDSTQCDLIYEGSGVSNIDDYFC